MSKTFKKDLTGQRFGRLTVLEFVQKNDNNNSFWKCRCDCGNICVVRRSCLLSRNTQSCGCLIESRIKHNLSGTRLYKIWGKMKERCLDTQKSRYIDYGGRGIRICEDWINDFVNFYKWALQNGYTDELTLDRIDTNGNYEPSNCRWVDMRTQSRNKRNNVNVEYNNEIVCLADASDKSGISYDTLRRRYERGDRGERLFRPVRKLKKL